MKPLINIQMLQMPLELAPGEDRTINFTGTYISILTNTILTDPIVCADSGSSTALRAGIGLPTTMLSPDGSTLIPAVFRYVNFKNPSLYETMKIEFLLSLGTPVDTRAIISGYLQMDLSGPMLESTGMVVHSEDPTVLPSNVLIKERIVQNNGDSPIWWGGQGLDPFDKNCLCIMPGGSATIQCSGEVLFLAEDGHNSFLSVVNIFKIRTIDAA